MIVRAPNARTVGWTLAGVAAAALLGGAVMALAAERQAPVLILPNRGAYFGGDLMAGLVASGMAWAEGSLWIGQHRGRDLGIFNLTNTFPSLIMPWLTISLVPGFGFDGLFLLLAGLAGMAVLLLATMPRPR